MFCVGFLGFTCELCAGIVDKSLSLSEIAHEEIMEECGYNVPASSLEVITSFNSSVGTAGSTQTLYFGKVKLSYLYYQLDNG